MFKSPDKNILSKKYPFDMGILKLTRFSFSQYRLNNAYE